jgi:hypothetical protein
LTDVKRWFAEDEQWGNGVASKHLTFGPACAPAVIAIAVYRKEDVDLGITRCLVVRQAVAPGIERGELGSEEETDYATTE